MQTNNVGLRLALTILLILGGFIFPLLFLFAALVGWALYSDLTKAAEPEPDAWYTRRWTATAEDPEWKSYYLPFCESPAETAFLEAAIDHYRLVPDKGVLRGSNLTLNLQVEIPPYRVDFLANDWLVVEVDGAAYHSSPEAIARDRERDQFLEAKGYTVLRIPAKLVLTEPREAMSRVEAAKAVGRKPRTSAGAKAVSRISLESVTKVAKSVDNFVTDLNAYVSRESAVQRATSKSRQIFEQEKLVIDGAYESGFREIELKATLRGKSDEFRKQYDEAYAEIAALIGNNAPPAKLTIPPITTPDPHADPKINEAIRQAHNDLMIERAVYFEVVRDSLSDERARAHGLPELVRSRLEEMGCLACWRFIAPNGIVRSAGSSISYDRD